MKKHLLSLSDLTPKQILALLSRARVLKQARKRGRQAASLKGKSLALVFEKPSTRTRVSFDIAMAELGGHSVYLETSSTQLGRGETYQDTAKVLSRYAHGIVMRTFAQKNLEEMAQASSVSIINGLSDLCHPCQILTDLFTIEEAKGSFLKKQICYIGDGNNMANTWIEAALLLGFSLKIATPKGYEPSPLVLKKIKSQKTQVVITEDPLEAIYEADVINTDTWFSMGQEVSKEKERVFSPYQINGKLLKQAKKDAIVLHCLPAHRGEEITEEVMDGSQSRVWDQAENRLHVQKALLEMFLR